MNMGSTEPSKPSSRQPQLRLEIESTAKKASIAHELADRLHGRLSGVLRNEPPAPPKGRSTDMAQELRVPAAQAIYECGQEIDITIVLLTSILERLEA